MARVILNNVDLDFPIYGTQHRSLRNAIYQRSTGGIIQRDGENNDRVVVRALSGISMRLEEGDRLGLIGHNGAGKSTLLKAIAGIYEPIRGSIMVEGSVTPLFDMMPGLDIEDTGYENIFTSGMLLGMSRDFIERKIPEIEEFCELGEYLSLPVRTYSAGMMMRLGFALVTALDPGVLLMDEGFGAADLRFAERSAERMNEFIGRSRIMVIASHSDAMIASICNKAAWLNEGRLIKIGPVGEILDEYRESVHRDKMQKADTGKNKEVKIPATPESLKPLYSEESIRDVGIEDRRIRTMGEVIFTKLVAKDSSGRTRWDYRHGETVLFHIEYEAIRPVHDLILLLRLYLPEDVGTGKPLQVVSDIHEVLSAERIEAGQRGTIEIIISNLPFTSNEFYVYGWIGRCDRSRCYDVVDQNVALPRLEIKSESRSTAGVGLVSLDYSVRKTDPEPAKTERASPLRV